MNSFAKLAMAVAAVVVVAIVGYNLLPSRGGVGGQPATPSPSISPSPVPPPTAQPSDAVKDGPLQPGTYTFYGIEGQVNVRFTVPARWSWFDEPDILTTGDPADEVAIALWPSGEDLQVYTDPCEWAGAEPDPPTGPSARDLVDALAAQPTRNGSTPIQRNAAGPDAPDQWTGWLVEQTVPEDIDFEACTRGEFRSWGPDDLARYHQGPGQRDTVWVIEVADTRIVVDATSLPGTPETTMTEIDAVLDSMVFERRS